jgi:hypothetical protein
MNWKECRGSGRGIFEGHPETFLEKLRETTKNIKAEN